ncbi:hypothetical protein BDK51DRAFT_25597 [Blyttiomyces helicus]|uniref:Uncharacterized protein n=1 Tax=Blyttiomyces helicus TaxID=388810 RepID=A0A4V1IRB1_9FUNG|nr:hypothetical protein BDK51DRAFT_25597 [Blyttiomyces helicus]|eukprot:RKO89437.1 hypothetical protein BDK51DRAFT_25597 [Blyttiomyces helicus]
MMGKRTAQSVKEYFLVVESSWYLEERGEGKDGKGGRGGGDGGGRRSVGDVQNATCPDPNLRKVELTHSPRTGYERNLRRSQEVLSQALLGCRPLVHERIQVLISDGGQAAHSHFGRNILFDGGIHVGTEDPQRSVRCTWRQSVVESVMRFHSCRTQCGPHRMQAPSKMQIDPGCGDRPPTSLADAWSSGRSARGLSIMLDKEQSKCNGPTLQSYLKNGPATIDDGTRMGSACPMVLNEAQTYRSEGLRKLQAFLERGASVNRASVARKFVAACPNGEIRILDLDEVPQSVSDLPEHPYEDRHVGMNLIIKYWMDQRGLDAFWKWVEEEKPLSPRWEDMRPIALDANDEVMEFESDKACAAWINERFRGCLDLEAGKTCGIMEGPCSTGEVYWDSERQYYAHLYQDIVSLEYEWLPCDSSSEHARLGFVRPQISPTTLDDLLSNAFDLKFCSGEGSYFTVVGMFKQEGKEPCIFHFESHCPTRHYRRSTIRHDVYASPVCRVENLGNGLP